MRQALTIDPHVGFRYQLARNPPIRWRFASVYSFESTPMTYCQPHSLVAKGLSANHGGKAGATRTFLTTNDTSRALITLSEVTRTEDLVSAAQCLFNTSGTCALCTQMSTVRFWEQTTPTSLLGVVLSVFLRKPTACKSRNLSADDCQILASMCSGCWLMMHLPVFPLLHALIVPWL